MEKAHSVYKTSRSGNIKSLGKRGRERERERGRERERERERER